MIDYQEAFVIEKELAEHSYICVTCQVAALKGGNFCIQFHRMKAFRDAAYEALPEPLKKRYLKAAQSIFTNERASYGRLDNGK